MTELVLQLLTITAVYFDRFIKVSDCNCEKSKLHGILATLLETKMINIQKPLSWNNLFPPHILKDLRENADDRTNISLTSWRQIVNTVFPRPGAYFKFIIEEPNNENNLKQPET